MRALLLVLALVALAACGKRGSPSPPGPENELVFPRVYPTR